MNGERESNWKEAVMALEGLTQTLKNPSHDNGCLGRDSNQAPP
jgi:hypothetical protein